MAFRVENMSFKQGQELRITARSTPGASQFSINIGHNSDNFALHFNPRFSSEKIVLNSLSGGSWGDENHEMHFPFQTGEEFKLAINFTNEQFYIKLPDGHMIDFPNRLGDCKYNQFMVDGDVKIVSIKVK
ncbi:lectin, galactoside-binding, soluble, 2b [Esox lucius]|uniref:Galectin n=1 Tax=Esox lucius TaxID=8010 RepID=A0AAY5K3H5_ESOLU|nr:lectin, galactoside-binding, soluble, 2b [Esox lucius]